MRVTPGESFGIYAAFAPMRTMDYPIIVIGMLELVRRGHINGVWLNKGNLAYRNTNETQGEPRLIGWMQARLLVKTFLEVDQ